MEALKIMEIEMPKAWEKRYKEFEEKYRNDTLQEIGNKNHDELILYLKLTKLCFFIKNANKTIKEIDEMMELKK